MSKEVIVFVIGTLLLVIPQLGVPERWKIIFYVLSGIVLIVIGYTLRRNAYLRSIDQGNGERSTDSYVESTSPIDWSQN